MELSKEWYHTELTNSEYDMLHRSRLLNILFTMLSKPVTWIL